MGAPEASNSLPTSRRGGPVTLTLLATLLVPGLSGCLAHWLPHRHRASMEADLAAAANLSETLQYYRHTTEHYLDNVPVEIPQVPPPLTVSNPEAKEKWPLTLREALEIALDNSGVVRRLRSSGRGQVATAADDLAPTVYDPAEAETAIEEALGAFDATLSMALFWGHTRRQLNNNVAQGVVVPEGEIFVQDTFGRSAAAVAGAGSLLSIQKRLATGGTISAAFDTSYDLPNLGRRFFRSAYESTLTFTLSQPLLRNAGVDTNRVAIVIARLRSDQQLWAFRQAVERLVQEVEQTYWQLAGAQRVLAAINETVRTHTEIVRRLRAEEAEGKANPSDVAQAMAELARIRRLRDLALGQETGGLITISSLPGAIPIPGVLAAERQLRGLLGLPPSDGRRIVAVDEPNIAPIQYDWNAVLTEAFAFHPEMQRLKLELAARRQELLFRRNQLLPQLDLFWQHLFFGLGDGFDDSIQQLTNTKFGDYTFGLQGQVSLGYRTESARMQAAVNRVARTKALLRDKGHELTHVLAQAVQELHLRSELYRKSLDNLMAARRSRDIQWANFQAGRLTIDQLLDAERAYFEAVNFEVLDRVAFQNALVDLETAKGTVLAYNNIHLHEGPWPLSAYGQARHLLHQRTSPLQWRHRPIFGSPLPPRHLPTYDQSAAQCLTTSDPPADALPPNRRDQSPATTGAEPSGIEVPLPLPNEHARPAQPAPAPGDANRHPAAANNQPGNTAPQPAPGPNADPSASDKPNHPRARQAATHRELVPVQPSPVSKP